VILFDNVVKISARPDRHFLPLRIFLAEQSQRPMGGGIAVNIDSRWPEDNGALNAPEPFSTRDFVSFKKPG